MTTILDDDGLAGKAPDIGERLHQRICFVDQLLHWCSLVAATIRLIPPGIGLKNATIAA
jgi:hypothetical protein